MSISLMRSENVWNFQTEKENEKEKEKPDAKALSGKNFDPSPLERTALSYIKNKLNGKDPIITKSKINHQKIKKIKLNYKDDKCAAFLDVPKLWIEEVRFQQGNFVQTEKGFGRITKSFSL